MTHVGLAECAYAQKDYVRCRETARQVTANPQAHINYQFSAHKFTGLSHFDEGDFESARKAFEAAIAVKGVNAIWKAEMRLQVGHCLRLDRRFAEARKTYETVLALKKAYPTHRAAAATRHRHRLLRGGRRGQSAGRLRSRHQDAPRGQGERVRRPTAAETA